VKTETMNTYARLVVLLPATLLAAALLSAAALAWRANSANTLPLPSLPGFQLVTDVSAATVAPQVSSTEATAAAITALGQDHTHFSSYRPTETAYVPGLRQVADHSGRLWYQTSVPENDHVIFFTAPPQAGWQYVAALVVVNGDTGKLESYQVRYGNSPDHVLP